ncbi:unnamed protein product [Tetraodon nigroviridis]|uniref:(spotted green pufferfish) hypothetical protein n=1 Tax=Tetraodon nigroviridis TaxID=99883 RepID=Q4T5T4_TETNG|nr:unnamed protein product [Tetraodon nigroviridis]
MSGPSVSTIGPMDVKKKERSSPSGEAGGPPLPHQAGPGGVDPDSAEVRRTSRRKRAKVINLKLTFPPLESDVSQNYEGALSQILRLRRCKSAEGCRRPPERAGPPKLMLI